MLQSIQKLIGFTLGATDGEIGKVKDIYFDDQSWQVRYLVVETGGWLFGRKVLLAPVAVHNPDWKEKVLPVNLSKDQIKNSPDIDTERPVSSQQEASLYQYYSWPVNPGGMGFMTTGMIGGVVAPDVPFEDRIADEMHHHENDPMSDRRPEAEHYDPHLRSFKAISGYNIHATDDELGEVDDLLFDADTWDIPFAVIETGNWYAGKKTLVLTRRIQKIEWTESSVYLDTTAVELKNSPEFDYDELNNLEYERNLRDHYQQR